MADKSSSESSLSKGYVEHGIDVHCKCGAYLGKIRQGYVTLIQCYCGEVLTIEKPTPEDLKAADHDLDLSSGYAAPTA